MLLVLGKACTCNDLVVVLGHSSLAESFTLLMFERNAYRLQECSAGSIEDARTPLFFNSHNKQCYIKCSTERILRRDTEGCLAAAYESVGKRNGVRFFKPSGQRKA